MAKKESPTPDFKRMYQLAEHYTKASKLLAKQARGKSWGSSAPQLLVDSFAAEIYLKCIYVLEISNPPPRDHDWKGLFEALAPATQEVIRSTFRQRIKSHPVLANLHIINSDAVKVTDFDRSLEAAKHTFDRRRYLYEGMPSGEWFYADLLREAVRAVTRMDLRLAPMIKKKPSSGDSQQVRRSETEE